MKSSFLIISFLILGLNLHLKAQTIDANAKSILDKTKKNYEKNNSSYIKFSYKLVNTAEGINETKNGEIFISKNKFNLTVMDINQIYDGNKLYTIYKTEKEVNITKPTQDELLSPTKILSAYSKGYNISMAGTKTVNGQSCKQIKLVPTGKSKTKDITLFVNNANELVQVSENNTSGTVTTITIQEYIKNMIIHASTFIFNKKNYKGYVITEL